MSTIPDKVKKIAVLRANAVGDFIVTLPALRAIRNSFPDAELILLGKPWHKNFLEESENGKTRTVIDRVIVLPVTEGLRTEEGKKEDPEEIRIFFDEITKENFDIVVNFHGKGIAANVFIKRMGAKFTVGPRCSESVPLDRSVNFYYYQSEIIRYLEIASLIGADTISIEPEITLLQKDKTEAQSFLKKNLLTDYIAIHPSGTDLRRMWTVEKYARLADKLIQDNFAVVFTGSFSESSLIESIQSKMEFLSVNSAGLSLGGMAALLSQSKLVISIDSGPLHLARAAGAKTVGLYWAPNLINWGPLSRKNHRPVISWKMQCPYCGLTPNDPFPFEPVSTTCNHAYSFIENISVEDVMKEVNHLLKDPGAS